MTPVLWLALGAAVALFAPLALAVWGLYAPSAAFDGWPGHVLWLTLLGALGLGIARRDRWLGVAVMMLGVHVTLRHGDLTACILVALAALGLILLLRATVHQRRHATMVLSVAAVMQALYVIQQWFGYDVVMAGLTRITEPRIVGTLGNPDKVGAALAILGPLLPWWGLPIIGAAILATHSLGALLGFSLALIIRYRHSWGAPLVAMLGGAFVTVLAATKGLATAAGRWEIWLVGLRDWWSTAPILGHGLGAWAQRVPALQISTPSLTTAHGLWTTAHSEPIQWLYETGLLGGVILAAWLWERRRIFLVPSVAALAVVSLTFHPFHTPALALVGVVILGLAMSQERISRLAMEVAKCQS